MSDENQSRFLYTCHVHHCIPGNSLCWFVTHCNQSLCRLLTQEFAEVMRALRARDTDSPFKALIQGLPHLVTVVGGGRGGAVVHLSGFDFWVFFLLKKTHHDVLGVGGEVWGGSRITTKILS